VILKQVPPTETAVAHGDEERACSESIPSSESYALLFVVVTSTPSTCTSSYTTIIIDNGEGGAIVPSMTHIRLVDTKQILGVLDESELLHNIDEKLAT
jgi:hypothetical protein